MPTMPNQPNNGWNSGDLCPSCAECELSIRGNARRGGFFLGCAKWCGFRCSVEMTSEGYRRRTRLESLLAAERDEDELEVARLAW